MNENVIKRFKSIVKESEMVLDYKDQIKLMVLLEILKRFN